jgi:hypothetical protein
MSPKIKKLYPALKHGAFCATGLLPGEDREAFEKLHKELVAELCPHGPLESDIVSTIARVLWRKQNLNTIRVAEFARDRLSAIRSEKVLTMVSAFREVDSDPDWNRSDADEFETAEKAAESEAKKELGIKDR